ncbi:GldG family protein, partial [Alphaproteobacteria bacterium]|nr:GldG family protein [Alphaproteobacteria bacterium]
MTTPQSPLLSTLGRRTAVALSLVLVLFLALNLLATSVSTSWRLDLTAQRLYTLSPASQNVINKIDEPITLRLFYSSSIAAAAPAIGSYAQRVKDLLQEYASLSNGRIRLEIIDPAPFSEAEDRAVSYGLQKVPLGGDEDGVFLGLVGTNTTDDVEAIAFLQPNREPFLEYDISKIVYGLSHVERTVVGIISTLPINGRASYNQQTGQQETVKPFAIMAQIEDFFDTKMLELDLTRIPEDVTVLMVVHPKNLPPQTLYAIDQFALGGGKVFALVDSYAEIEVQNSRNPTMAGVEANSIPADLLAAWGIKINELEVAADRLTARRVS